MCCTGAQWKREVVPDHKVRFKPQFSLSLALLGDIQSYWYGTRRIMRYSQERSKIQESWKGVKREMSEERRNRQRDIELE